jgi:hypothetical protein
LDATQANLGCFGDFSVKLGSCFKIAHLNPLLCLGFRATESQSKCYNLTQ